MIYALNCSKRKKMKAKWKKIMVAINRRSQHLQQCKFTRAGTVFVTRDLDL